MAIAALINGHPPGDLNRAIALNDRGFHYGDGLFETALLTNGKVRFLTAHLDRLAHGCEILGIQGPTRGVLEDEIACVTHDLQSGVLKIIVSRGVGQRGYRPAMDNTPTRVIVLYPDNVDRSKAELRRVRLRWCAIRMGRNVQLAGLKHLSRLENVLAQSEWQDPAIEEGLMLDTEAEVVCGTATNVFAVKDGVLITPDLRFCGVRGVMRAQVLRAARDLGITAEEAPLWPQDFESASEVFVTNAIHGIRCAFALDEMHWGQPSVASRLAEALRLL
jgi:4-amino-4-deoxychorismate lyase